VNQTAEIQQLIKFMDSVDDQRDNYCSISKKAVFAFSLVRVFQFIREVIKSARNQEEFFYYDVKSKIQLQNFLRWSLTHETLKNFNKIVSSIKENFLISLDGFDTAFEEFRRYTMVQFNNSEEAIKRTMLEIDWLRSFLHLVMMIKSNHSRSIFYRKIHFCVTVPKDRFMEVLRIERDAYNYAGRFIEIRWSGVELSILFRKRLEVWLEYTTSKDKNQHYKKPDERISEIFPTKFPFIPQLIITNSGGIEQKIPLFIYVLRHTFWRPRDLLYYFGKILSVCFDMHEKGRNINSDTIKKIVSNATYDVINTEFINEFQTSVTNIRDIISSFLKKPQVLPYARLEEILQSIDFRFIDKTQPISDIENKIAFLYEIGFLGLYATEAEMARFGYLDRHAFFFNEGDKLLQNISRDHFNEMTFIIHPIFFEYLRLKPATTGLSLNFTWDYLYDNESHLASGQ
jgi:hypothetical protein